MKLIISRSQWEEMGRKAGWGYDDDYTAADAATDEWADRVHDYLKENRNILDGCIESAIDEWESKVAKHIPNPNNKKLDFNDALTYFFINFNNDKNWNDDVSRAVRLSQVSPQYTEDDLYDKAMERVNDSGDWSTIGSLYGIMSNWINNGYLESDDVYNETWGYKITDKAKSEVPAEQISSMEDILYKTCEPLIRNTMKDIEKEYIEDNLVGYDGLKEYIDENIDEFDDIYDEAKQRASDEISDGISEAETYRSMMGRI